MTQPYNVSQREAVAGIMIRKYDEDGFVPGLRHAALLVSAGSNGTVTAHRIQFVARKVDQRVPPKSLPDKRGSKPGQKLAVVAEGQTQVPVWLRLLCEPKTTGGSDFTFTASISADGNSWQIFGKTEIAIDGRVMVSLVGASQLDDDPKNSQNPAKVQARFSQVKVTPMF